jgi:hypothetical protein
MNSLFRDPRSRRSSGRGAVIFLPALALLILVLASHGQEPPRSGTLKVLSSITKPPTVGMEGRLEVLLAQAGLTAKKADRQAPMLLRIAFSRPHGTLTHYDLRYIGRVPGQYDLRDYLVTPEGIPPANLPALPVTVTGVLPLPHNGWLEEQALRTPSLFGGYRVFATAAVAFWIIAFVLIVRAGRKLKFPTIAEPVRRPPTFAERLRPLVERAAAGQLSADEQAALERMLITHWQRRLGLGGLDGAELIVRLRQHSEAGALLRALEDWLHRPPGSVKVVLEPVLAPYRDLPSEERAEPAKFEKP